MSVRSASNAALTVILAVCASLIAVSAVHREFFPPPVASAGTPPRHISGGSKLLLAGHTIGTSRAPRKIVEFSDFQCPYCLRLSQTLDTLLAQHPSDVSIVYRHFPLSIHPLAMPAAIASECVSDQGHFAEFASLLFSKHDSIGIVSLTDLAKRAGATDTLAFARCMTGKSAKARVEADMAAGNSLGITGTPALVIGDSLFVGATSLDSIERRLGLRRSISK